MLAFKVSWFYMYSGPFLPFLLQLLGVVQETIGDVEGLHSKLDRKSRVEETNLSSVALHQSNMHSAVDTLHHGLQGFSDAQQLAYTQFSARISKSQNSTAPKSVVQAGRHFFVNQKRGCQYKNQIYMLVL